MLLLALLLATPAALWPQDVSQQITRVETGLTRKVQIKGEPVQKWTVTDLLQHRHVPGVSVAVVSEGKLAWAKGFGMAREDQPVTLDTLFQAASISKTVSAMTALRLVELGKLSLDEDVNLKLPMKLLILCALGSALGPT